MQRQDLPIASPCAQDWDTMTRAGKKRFCGECKKHVQDLSMLSEPEARELLAAPPAAGLCVSYMYNTMGAIVFDRVDTSLVPTSHLARGSARALAHAALATMTLAGIALASTTLTGCMGAAERAPAAAPAAAPAQQLTAEPAYERMTGDPAPTREPTTAAPIAGPTGAPKATQP